MRTPYLLSVRKGMYFLLLPGFLLIYRADHSQNCKKERKKKKKRKNLSLSSFVPHPLNPPTSELSPHELFPFFSPLSRSKHVRGLLPLFKGYNIWCHAWNYLNKRYLWVQWGNKLIRDFFEWESPLCCSTHPRHSGCLLSAPWMCLSTSNYSPPSYFSSS